MNCWEEVELNTDVVTHIVCRPVNSAYEVHVEKEYFFKTRSSSLLEDDCRQSARAVPAGGLTMAPAPTRRKEKRAREK